MPQGKSREGDGGGCYFSLRHNPGEDEEVWAGVVAED